MTATRTRSECSRLFQVFAKVDRCLSSAVSSAQQTQRSISYVYPHSCPDEELLNCLPKFAFPVSEEFTSSVVDHFTFVLTDIESIFRFGFCRLSADSETCLCIVSYRPWFDIFFHLLNYVADLFKTDADVAAFLDVLFNCDVSKPRTQFEFDITPALPQAQKFTFVSPLKDILPSIPEDRNLMEYYSAVDCNNMIALFASLLFERRVIITTRRLSRLTACVHSAESLLYPLHWQQIYIPTLPPHLLDYCSAPMPYLIGIHSSLLTDRQKAELHDAVILDADRNRITCPYDDVSVLPAKVVRLLRKKLKMNDATSSKQHVAPLLGDMLSRAFLSAVVHIIGDYRSAVSYSQDAGRFVFSDAQYVENRSSKQRPMVNSLLASQSFRQFIEERLSLLNGAGATERTTRRDVFEEELKQFVEYKKHSKTLKSVKKTFKGVWKFPESKKSGEERQAIQSLKRWQQSNLAQRKLTSHSQEILSSESTNVVPRSGCESVQCDGAVVCVKRIQSKDDADLFTTSRFSGAGLLTDPDVQHVISKSFSFGDLLSPTATQRSQSDDKSSVCSLSDDQLSQANELHDTTYSLSSNTLNTYGNKGELQANSNDVVAGEQADAAPSEGAEEQTNDVGVPTFMSDNTDAKKSLSRVQQLVKCLETRSADVGETSAANSSAKSPVPDLPSVALRRDALLMAARCKQHMTRCSLQCAVDSGQLESVAARTQNLLQYVAGSLNHPKDSLVQQNATTTARSRSMSGNPSVQRDPVQLTDSSVQHDPVQLRNHSVQRDVMQSKDSLIRDDPVQLRDPSVQRDTAAQFREYSIDDDAEELRNPSVQHDVMLSNDDLIQHDPVRLGDASLQLDFVELRVPSVQDDTVQLRDPSVQDGPVQLRNTSAVKCDIMRSRDYLIKHESVQLRDPLVQHDDVQFREYSIHDDAVEESMDPSVQRDTMQ